jgi:hypothetical protein
MKAQATVYAAFASGSLTVAILNIAALALVWSVRAVLLAERETPCPDAGPREEPLRPRGCSNPCSPHLQQALR